MLVLGDLEIWRGETCVMRDLSLRAEAPGLLWIIGPGGAGKSSLLMAMAGRTLDGGLRLSGRCTWGGTELHALGGRLACLPQHPRGAHAGAPLDAGGVDGLRAQRAERQFRDVLDLLDRDADVYLLDEPTAGLEEAQAVIVRERLRERAAQALVVAVTHNRQDCIALGGSVAFVAGGVLHETAPVERFFTAPSTKAGSLYVETGNCGIDVTARRSPGANGLWWAVPGLLCGLSRPGLVGDVVATYRDLAAAGIRRLLCLEERCAYPTEQLRQFGVSLHRFAIPDMAPPSFSQAVDICRLAEPDIRANAGVAAHCRGGLGRTGTVLAAILVWFGDPPETAIQRVRAAQPRAIQTDAQERFLRDFADRIRGWH